MKPKKPRKPDSFKGMKKVIPIRPSEKELSFEERVEKFGEYVDDPEQHGKIFTELGFTYVDDACGDICDICEQKADYTVYESIKDFEMSRKKEKKTSKVVPFKKK